jgi:hypothetical protein
VANVVRELNPANVLRAPDDAPASTSSDNKRIKMIAKAKVSDKRRDRYKPECYILLASNLSEDLTDCDHLDALFGVYDVICTVKVSAGAHGLHPRGQAGRQAPRQGDTLVQATMVSECKNISLLNKYQETC